MHDARDSNRGPLNWEAIALIFQKNGYCILLLYVLIFISNIVLSKPYPVEQWWLYTTWRTLTRVQGSCFDVQRDGTFGLAHPISIWTNVVSIKSKFNFLWKLMIQFKRTCQVTIYKNDILVCTRNKGWFLPEHVDNFLINIGKNNNGIQCQVKYSSVLTVICYSLISFFSVIIVIEFALKYYIWDVPLRKY